jgi:hypothetical protein
MVMLSWELKYHELADKLEGFRKLDAYLLTFFTVQNNKKVWDAFLKWSTLDHTQAFYAISYGTYPKIQLYDTIFSNPHSHGHFKPKFPDVITVSLQMAQKLHWAETAQEKLMAEKSLEYLILHEMCHWGRHKNGQQDGNYSKTNGKFNEDLSGNLDTGDRFELEAYTNPAQPWIP